VPFSVVVYGEVSGYVLGVGKTIKINNKNREIIQARLTHKYSDS
jgi:hypothetical protein